MTEAMDHDACSQLLRAYLVGEADDDAPAIAAHLEGCPECRAERAALEMLLAPVKGLTPAERAQLRTGVDRATRVASPSALRAVSSLSTRPARGSPNRATSSPAPKPQNAERFRHLASALSAAAAILLIATGVVLFQHLGAGSSNSAAQSSAAHGAAQPGLGATKTRGGLGIGRNAPSSLPLPRFARHRLPTTIRAETRAAAILPAFVAAYNGTEAEHLAPSFLRRLARAAPQALAPQVQQCGNRVLDEPGVGALPAYGATTAVNGQPVLVLVFATSSSPGASLTRLELRAWPLGSCGGELLRRSATITR
jgi:hypothetical protein